MSSLYSHELIKALLRGTSTRNYSVASKNRKLSFPKSTPNHGNTPIHQPATTSHRSTTDSLPRPRPPPPAPPPSWRFPFNGSSLSTGTGAGTGARNKGASSTLSQSAGTNQLGESESYYDLSKQASWSDPPLVARARSKTVKQRNVLESYLVLPPETRLKFSLALFAVGLIGLYAGDWFVPETEQERQVRQGEHVELPARETGGTTGSND